MVAQSEPLQKWGVQRDQLYDDLRGKPHVLEHNTIFFAIRVQFISFLSSFGHLQLDFIVQDDAFWVVLLLESYIIIDSPNRCALET